MRLMTDGLLLAEIQRDRLLRRYDTIIVDEAHERSLNIDFLLGYLKRILPAAARPEADHHVGDDRPASASPRTSATRRSSRCPGARIPVEVRYRAAATRTTDQIDAIGDAVDELLREGPGDVLVFLSGEREIRDTADALRGPPARPTSRCCRSTRGCRPPSSSASSSRTPGGASCWPPTSPRRR